MPYLLLSIAIPLILLAAFVSINMYYDYKEDKHFRKTIKKFPKEVENKLELDEHERKIS